MSDSVVTPDKTSKVLKPHRFPSSMSVVQLWKYESSVKIVKITKRSLSCQVCPVIIGKSFTNALTYHRSLTFLRDRGRKY